MQYTILPEFTTTRTWGPVPKYPKVLTAPSKNSQEPVIIAGPCFIESEKLVEQVSDVLVKHGVTYMRGGVYRAGTYPPIDNFGFQADKLKMWHGIAKRKGLNIIVECLDVRLLDTILKYADAVQIGARAMQNYALLMEARNCGKPIFLKRHHGATLDEFLGAAEYLCGGNCAPHLIERGGVSYHNHVRWELSCSLIAAVKRMTGLPIIVDASHGSGRADLVMPLTLAGIAAGADGFLVEIHPNPIESLSDAQQALHISKYEGLKSKAIAVRQAITGA